MNETKKRAYGKLRLRSASLERLSVEVAGARRKFPRNRHLLAALTEEVGELAQAILQRKDREDLDKEALQVACVAMRIFEEGDSAFDDLTDEECKP